MLIRRSDKRKNFIGLTSLIDVIFLLLLFFMLSSTFTKFTEFSLSAASAGTTDSVLPKPVLIVVRPDGRFDVDGTLIGSNELESLIDRLAGSGQASAVVAPHGELTTQELVSILERLQQTRLTSVSLAR